MAINRINRGIPGYSGIKGRVKIFNRSVKHPSTKLQYPENIQTPNSKSGVVERFGIGAWSLGVSLDVGAFPPSAFLPCQAARYKFKSDSK
jgi:hypothetical protein